MSSVSDVWLPKALTSIPGGAVPLLLICMLAQAPNKVNYLTIVLTNEFVDKFAVLKACSIHAFKPVNLSTNSFLKLVSKLTVNYCFLIKPLLFFPLISCWQWWIKKRQPTCITTPFSFSNCGWPNYIGLDNWVQPTHTDCTALLSRSIWRHWWTI